MRSVIMMSGLIGLVSGCASDTQDTQDTQDTASRIATWDDVRPILSAHCSRCHSDDRLATYRLLQTHEEVTRLRTNILDKLQVEPPRGRRMPLVSNHEDAAGCQPQHTPTNDRRLTAGELDTVVEFLQRTDHLDYVDTTEPLSPPDVPQLADAVEYVSSQYDVLNDGFITPPEGVSDEFMHEYGYDQRDFDQMEDDWFCIRFDPQQVDPAFVTGVQIQTDIGQIYLNSQLLIDTNGSFADAQQRADERGSDWYKCDAGHGMTGALPLWRTPPGGGPIELPEDTGLRFEPGWTFVVRADFHTHFDAAEFERLNQNGEIDRDAGTMTWFDRANLKVRWADTVERELQWMTIGPQSAQEREAFRVPRGETTRTYTSMPLAEGEYSVFSAEVGMGKNGTVATLVETGSNTCVANNADFAPKWIEPVLYAEDDAPALDGDSVLELNCSYRNEEDTVGWGDESEATVWGRQERCRGLVYYYDR